MEVAGIRRVNAPVETIEVSGPRPLAPDEVLLEVPADAAHAPALTTGGHGAGAIVVVP